MTMRLKNSNGLERSNFFAASPFAKRYMLLICSHISLVICSRVVRAFSRASDKQERIELGFFFCRLTKSIVALPSSVA